MEHEISVFIGSLADPNPEIRADAAKRLACSFTQELSIQQITYLIEYGKSVDDESEHETGKKPKYPFWDSGQSEGSPGYGTILTERLRLLLNRQVLSLPNELLERLADLPDFWEDRLWGMPDTPYQYRATEPVDCKQIRSMAKKERRRRGLNPSIGRRLLTTLQSFSLSRKRPL